MVVLFKKYLVKKVGDSIFQMKVGQRHVCWQSSVMTYHLSKETIFTAVHLSHYLVKKAFCVNTIWYQNNW